MAEPAPKPADAETITDRIMAAAEEAHLKVKAHDTKKGGPKGDPAPEPTDPKARVEGLFSAVSAELSSAGSDTDKLKELQAALQSTAGLISRAVEAAIEDAIAMANQEAAEKAAAEPPPKPAATGTAAPASASPSAHAGAKAPEAAHAAPAKK